MDRKRVPLSLLQAGWFFYKSCGIRCQNKENPPPVHTVRMGGGSFTSEKPTGFLESQP